MILAIKVQKTAKGSHTVFKENLTSDIRKLKTTALYKDNLATGECYKEGIDAWETDRLSGELPKEPDDSVKKPKSAPQRQLSLH